MMPDAGARTAVIETFVPLYLSNECDGVCSVCSMRSTNSAMVRLPIDVAAAQEQLRIIRDVEGVSAVCLLTGEYRRGERREGALRSVRQLARWALDHGYERVLVNVGALDDPEIHAFQVEFPADGRLVLSLFQETYDVVRYRRIFGRSATNNPKADFVRRRSTPERWLAAGFSAVDIGILVGVGPLEADLRSLIEHADELHRRGASVAISLPRIRGIRAPELVDDVRYRAALALVAHRCPWAKPIITTRERLDFIRSVLPYVRIVSPGSSDVLPYGETGPIPNRLETSQFVVDAERPRPSWTLRALSLTVGSIRYFNPPKEV